MNMPWKALVVFLLTLLPPLSLAPNVPRVYGELPTEAAQDITTIRDLDVLEIFQGIGNVVSSARDAGLTAEGYDVELDKENHDIVEHAGWVTIRGLAMRVKKNGLAWLAPECSWWTFSCSSHHQRYDRIEGDATKVKVRETNKMARRVAWLLEFFHIRNVHCITENPRGSQYFNFPVTARILEVYGFISVVCFMCYYAASHLAKGEVHAKPFKLWGNTPFLKELQHDCCHRHIPGKHKPLMEPSGTQWVSGNNFMKPSQAYPKAFTDDIIAIYKKFSDDLV